MGGGGVGYLTFEKISGGEAFFLDASRYIPLDAIYISIITMDHIGMCWGSR